MKGQEVEVNSCLDQNVVEMPNLVETSDISFLMILIKDYDHN